jgi:tetratricopeptide (TPR) repeat protein
MNKYVARTVGSVLAMVLVLGTAALIFITRGPEATASETRGPVQYTGSASCRECHERFYQLWSTSRHGLAMQPYTADFAQARLTPQSNPVVIGKLKYRADVVRGLVSEAGLQGTTRYRIEQVLGGKNVYYFLTPLKRGRLQTLPVAYDVNRKEWFDTAASGVRHFPGRDRSRPVHWKESPYTFNTSCYGCHVSQLSTNYHFKTDTYKTTWAEPGINCETCHGSSVEHNRVMKAAPQGQPPQDMKIISVKKFTVEQHNSACSTCHLKGTPLTTTFTPGDRLFDHFDLVTLENPDYYADGRDLGENYTYTSWLMSPCVKSGKLSCIKCHTSSGRYRFKAEEKAQEACMPCHENKVQDPTAHTRHQPDSPGNKCVSCHLPLTSFARMNRSDHSMRPPMPAATIAYKSPNACNGCHPDKDAAWADRFVRQWRSRDYQAPALRQAALIDGARRRDWSKLPEMLDTIAGPGRDEVFAASLLRLLPGAQDSRTQEAVLKAMKDPSPLVRAAAAENLGLNLSPKTVAALIEAAGDDTRLVRIKAAASLSGYPLEKLKGEEAQRLEKANREYLAFIRARPDQWTAHYNLGNYYLSRGELQPAVDSFKTAIRMEPQAVLAMVNASIAYSRLGDNRKAEAALQQALKAAPDSGAANFNMGLMKAEQKDLKQAERYLRAALKADPQMAQPAYNLCVLLSRDRPEEAIGFCRKAAELQPEEPRYSFTLAYYLHKKGENQQAAALLDTVLEKHPHYRDAQLLKREIAGSRPKP